MAQEINGQSIPGLTLRNTHAFLTGLPSGPDAIVPLKGLKALRRLDLSGNNIGGIDLAIIEDWTGLEDWTCPATA